MAHPFEELFGDLEGGYVLDVATGKGGFIQILKRYLPNITGIIGVDINKDMLRNSQQAQGNLAGEFVQANAEQLSFNDCTFDTVNISASLHHMGNVGRVLGEMKRVLKVGGNFICTEMHRDGMSEAQFNAVRIHHWAAAVDTCLGRLHDRTFAREEILDFVDEMNVSVKTVREIKNTDSEPTKEEAVKSVQNYLDAYLQRARIAAGDGKLIQNGLELRESLSQSGFQKEPVLIVVAEKI
ncbi:MAG: class I SAM-dependent methyltransferase [Chloroflexota bacterium]|nr:MAG: class I SAM-dependent methyltransferase [Chloroflexota bacterium]